MPAAGCCCLPSQSALHQPPPVPVLVLLLVGYGVLTALFRPALTAYIPELVALDRLAAANAAYYIALQAAMLAGPAIGAALIGLGSATIALQLNGASFLLAAAATVALPARPPAAPSRGEGVASLLEGFRVARRSGWIGGTIVLISITNLGIIGAQRVALPKAAADRYGHLGGYSATMVAIALGSIVAATLASRARPPREPGRTTYTAALVLGAATAGFGVARGIVLAVLLGLAFGAGQQLAELWWITSLQRLLPDRLRGRVAAVADFGSLALLPLSFAIGGVIVEAVGPQVVLLAAGAIGMLTATIGLVVPAVHRWRPVVDGLAADTSGRSDPRSSSLLEGGT